MKAAVVREFGQPLVREDRPVPSPGRRQVTVRMEGEGASVVHATGEGVSGLTMGQRVAVPCLQQLDNGYSVDGCYAEYFLAEAAFAAKVPDGDSIPEILHGKAKARIVMTP